jgi:hypothetical protein
MVTETVSVKCPCGATHRFAVAHYDRVIVKCRRLYWALQPKRSGPLALFPWPGHNLSREEMGGRPSAETIVRRMNEKEKQPNADISHRRAEVNKCN